jgi:hypothetical protein
MSGKGTGEYRKGQTPSDIASRSVTPELEGMSHRPDHHLLEGLIFDSARDRLGLMDPNEGEYGLGEGGVEMTGVQDDSMDGGPLSRSVIGGSGGIGPYTDQGQTLAMAAHVLNGYRPDTQHQHQHQHQQQQHHHSNST